MSSNFVVFISSCSARFRARRSQPPAPPDAIAGSLVAVSLRVTACRDRDLWDCTVIATDGHPLQLWGWGELKSCYAWTTDRLLVHDGAELVGYAQVLYRRLPSPFKSLAYVPRGPQAAERDRARVLTVLADYVKDTHGSLALSIEPDWPNPQSPFNKGVSDVDIAMIESQSPAGWLANIVAVGFTRGANIGLIPRTLIIDLTPSEEDLLKSFSSSTRQNVRKSFRIENVRVEEVTGETDLEQVLAINRETGRRAGFAVHDDAYHRRIRDLIGSRSQLLAIWEGDQVVAFVWLLISGTTAFELYGGVSPRGMQLRLNYRLKFSALKHVKEQGVSRYDFNGLLNDGISDFKRQFAKHENLLIGTWSKPLSPLYLVFATALPKVKCGLSVVKKIVSAARVAVRDSKGMLQHAKIRLSSKPKS